MQVKYFSQLFFTMHSCSGCRFLCEIQIAKGVFDVMRSVPALPTSRPLWLKGVELSSPDHLHQASCSCSTSSQLVFRLCRLLRVAVRERKCSQGQYLISGVVLCFCYTLYSWRIISGTSSKTKTMKNELYFLKYLAYKEITLEASSS